MNRVIGTVVRGVRGPIINKGDNLVNIVTEAMTQAALEANINFNDRDIIAITESVVARAQGNIVTVDDIAADINRKFESDTLGLVFPILSRNRFSICLKAFARAKKKLVILLSYPNDEVGNELLDARTLYESGVNPFNTVLTEEEFVKKFGQPCHPFTKMNYMQFYKDICTSENCECQFILANNAEAILDYCTEVLCCDIHQREITADRLQKAGAKKVLTMHNIMTEAIGGSGYNPKYGLLGSNKAGEEKIKLFPRECFDLVADIQRKMLEKTGKKLEVMVYGDGAFKDPVGKIWELADPVVSPAYTSGLEGTPHELKLKYLADNDFSHLSSEEQKEAIKARIAAKSDEETAGMAGQGTTPRRLTDLIGSLCDLTSGSGDKGTPFILIQSYFDNYSKDN